MHVECCKYSQQNWIKFVYACGPVSFAFLSRLTLRFSMLLFTDNIEGRRDAMNPSWTWNPKRRVHTWSHGLSRRLLSTPMRSGPWDVLRCNPMACLTFGVSTCLCTCTWLQKCTRRTSSSGVLSLLFTKHAVTKKPSPAERFIVHRLCVLWRRLPLSRKRCCWRSKMILSMVRAVR